MLEVTCGTCPHLKFSDMLGLKTAYCGHSADDDFIVPHQSRLQNGKSGDDTLMTLTRIPIHCPRDDKGVLKSAEGCAPKAEDWVTLTVPA